MINENATNRKAWINGLLLLVTLAVNTLGAIGVINGLSQKQISDRYPTLITPSPATFSIWSVIYTLLLAALIVMIVRKSDPYHAGAVNRISTLFWVSCLLNIAWIVTFSFEWVEISVIFILSFAVVLALINRQLLAMHEHKRWLLPLAFGLYSGWLFIAAVVNIAAALVKMRWDGFGFASTSWAAAILIVAVVLVVIVLLINRNAVFPLPVAWAYFGIGQNLRLNAAASAGDAGLVWIVAYAGMAVLIAAALIQLVRNRFSLLGTAGSATVETR